MTAEEARIYELKESQKKMDQSLDVTGEIYQKLDINA